MTTREVILDGGSPWGFRMHGGADTGQVLRIARVNPGSKAAQKGIREGDVISAINGVSTKTVTNSDAHALLRNAGQSLRLGLNEESVGSPKRRLHRNLQPELKADNKRVNGTSEICTEPLITQTEITSNQSAPIGESSDAVPSGLSDTESAAQDPEKGSEDMPKDQAISSSRGRRLRRQRIKKVKQQQQSKHPLQTQSDSPSSPVIIDNQLSGDEIASTAAESSDSSSQKTVILIRTDSVDTEASLETDLIQEVESHLGNNSLIDDETKNEEFQQIDERNISENISLRYNEENIQNSSLSEPFNINISFNENKQEPNKDKENDVCENEKSQKMKNISTNEITQKCNKNEIETHPSNIKSETITKEDKHNDLTEIAREVNEEKDVVKKIKIEEKRDDIQEMNVELEKNNSLPVEEHSNEIVIREQRCLVETITIQHFTEQRAVVNEPQEWESVQELPIIQSQAASIDEEKRERAEKIKTEDTVFDDSNLSLEDQELLEDTSMPAQEEEDLRRFLETLNLNEHSRSRKRNSSETMYCPFPPRHLDVIQEEVSEIDNEKQEVEKVKTKIIDDKEKGWKNIIYIEETGQIIELDENDSKIVVDLAESGDELEAITPERSENNKMENEVEIVFLEDEDSASACSQAGIDADVSDESTLEPVSERADVCTPGKFDEIFDEILENDNEHIGKIIKKECNNTDSKIICQEISFDQNNKIQTVNLIFNKEQMIRSNVQLNEKPEEENNFNEKIGEEKIKYNNNNNNNNEKEIKNNNEENEINNNKQENIINKNKEENEIIEYNNENVIDETSTQSVQVLKDHFTNLAQNNRLALESIHKRNDVDNNNKSINDKLKETKSKTNVIINENETHELTMRKCEKSELKEILCKEHEENNTVSPKREMKIDMNNSHEHTVELLRQLLSSPHQPEPETSLASLLNQLTVAQFANFSPTMRQQINALLETNSQDQFSIEAENILENLTPHHSRQASSSSDAASHSTAVYNPDPETRLAIKRPKTLRKLAVDVVLALPLGEFYLKQIGISVSRPSSFCDSIGSKEKEETSSLKREILLNDSQNNQNLETRKEEIKKKDCNSPIQFIDEDTPEMKNSQCFIDSHPIESDGTRPQSGASTVDSFGVEWTPVPTEDPHVAVYLSPSQRNSCRPTPELADSLLDLHLKFSGRRGYHEGAGQNSLERDFDSLKRKVESRVNNGSSASERLMAIIRNTSEGIRCSSVPLDHCNDSTTQINCLDDERRSSWAMDHSANPRLQANHLADWLKLARGGNSPIKAPKVKSPPLPPKSEKNISKTETYKNENNKTKETCSSLIENLAKNFEKLNNNNNNNKLIKKSSSYETTTSSVSTIVINSNTNTNLSNSTTIQSTPITDGEVFRQQMYNEYMNKVAEIADRRRRKVIKVSTSQDQNASGPTTPVSIEAEFFGKLRERMDKLGISNEDSEGENDNSEQLPKHLEEILAAAGAVENDDGVWTPGQKAADTGPLFQLTDVTKLVGQNTTDSSEPPSTSVDLRPQTPPPAIWTPKSSPTPERKQFRPVNFESPTLSRKNKAAVFSVPVAIATEDAKSNASTPTTPVQASELNSALPPWECEERRLVQSRSAPAVGLSSLASTSSSKLPRAQNPTITLLQKAREGQLPRGAHYLDSNLSGMPSSGKPDPDSDVERERRRRTLEKMPRQYEGIGPTTKEGIPIVLRSEVKDTNQAKWYKRMYDSLHRAGKDARYPYTSAAGYLSEPEPALADSDTVTSKYATLDRRRIRNKENDFTTSTMPRNKYVAPHADSIKYANEVYKNQPGRIEDYVPGQSSISDQEAKQWWDEVLEIFDGQLAAAEKQNRAATTPSGGKSFMTHALKESGYESDSTLVFKRRDETAAAQQPSLAEQRLAYKTIQRGGEVPLHGLRKPAPERPKEESLEYFPITPHLTRIRVHKNQPMPLREITCYPVMTIPKNPPLVFSSYKRTAPSATSSTTPIPSSSTSARTPPRHSSPSPSPPQPPRRRSSRHSSTLRLWTEMKVPQSGRHSSCFSPPRTDQVTYLREKISSKLNEKRTRATSSSASPSPSPSSRKAKQDATSARLCSRSPEPCRREKKLRTSTTATSSSPSSGTVVKSSTAYYSSSRINPKIEDKSLKVTVAISARGREILRSSMAKPLSKSPSPSPSHSTDYRSISPKVDTGLRRTTSSISISKKYPKKEEKKEKLKDKNGENKRKEKNKEKDKSSSKKSIRKTTTISQVEIEKRRRKPKEETKNYTKPEERVFKTNDTNVSTEKRKSRLDTLPSKNLEKDSSEFGSGLDLSQKIINTDNFFQHLLLRDFPSPAPSISSIYRSSSVLEKAKKFQDPNPSNKPEPFTGMINIYLANKKPVSLSRFKEFDKLNHFSSRSPSPNMKSTAHISLMSSRSTSPDVSKTRSISEPPLKSPSLNEIIEPETRCYSPSCRKIKNVRDKNCKTLETISGLKHKLPRARSAGEADRPIKKIIPPMQSSSSLNISKLVDHNEYQAYILELIHSTRKCERFKELHKFYTSLERMGELERTTSTGDLRPRLKDEEIIDFDRWKQVRQKERAEKELNILYKKLKQDQRDKDLLFRPKDVDTFRWKGDRGLRCRDRSVEDLKQLFGKLEESETDLSKKCEMEIHKDTYKPLWRGSSVLNLAHTMVTKANRNSQPIGRLNAKGLWSSLSMDQVNAFKSQLSEIYNTRLEKNKYEIEVPTKVSAPLPVRSHSLVSSDQLYSITSKKTNRRRNETMKADSISSIPNWKQSSPESKIMPESEKKKISMNLSKEVMDRAKKKPSPPKTNSSEISPRTCYSLDMSVEGGEGGKNDFLLVLTPSEKKQETKKVVEEWANSKSDQENNISATSISEESVSSETSSKTVIHRSDYKKKEENSGRKSHEPIKKTRSSSAPERQALSSSQSFVNLKELFGEEERFKQSHDLTYDVFTRDQQRRHAEQLKNSTIYYLDTVKNGDVLRLRNKFEQSSDELPEIMSIKRSSSDPELRGIIVRAQEIGDVAWLKSKYEYASKPKRGAKSLSPVHRVPLRAHGRYMPHINVISKTAALQRSNEHNSNYNINFEKPPQGEVSRIRNKFEQISLMGQLFTSTPDFRELRDIGLGDDWAAHRTDEKDRPRSTSSPELRSPPSVPKILPGTSSKSPQLISRIRPSSSSPVRLHHQESPPSILKPPDPFADQQFDPVIHRPLYRYQPSPTPMMYRAKPLHSRCDRVVKFQGAHLSQAFRELRSDQ